MVFYDVTDNKEHQQFEVHYESEIASLAYCFHNGVLVLEHTNVPPKLEGKGIASALAKYAFECAREHKKKVVVHCSFIAAFLMRNPEYNEIVETKAD